MSTQTPIAAIGIGQRHRQDMGDLAALAESIRDVGLLQPIGITRECELVFGERRLRACQLLGWTEIATRVVNLESIAIGEYHENEVRKDFTVSERVAILQTIERRPLGSNQYRGSENLPTLSREQAVARAGLGNTTTARHAITIGKQGIPALVDAVDRREIALEPGYAIALQSPARQAELVVMPTADRHAAMRTIVRPGHRNGKESPAAKKTKPDTDRKIKASELAAINAEARRNAEAYRVQVLGQPRRVLTDEEMGFPPPGSSVAEYDAYYNKHGARTPLVTLDIKELQDANLMGIDLVAAVGKAADPDLPDAATFFAGMDLLLAYVQDKAKDPRDFAQYGRERLKLLEERLPRALTLLTELAAEMKRRRQPQIGATPDDQSAT